MGLHPRDAFISELLPYAIGLIYEFVITTLRTKVVRAGLRNITTGPRTSYSEIFLSSAPIFSMKASDAFGHVTLQKNENEIVGYKRTMYLVSSAMNDYDLCEMDASACHGYPQRWPLPGRVFGQY